MGWTDEGITSWETDELFLGPLWKISHILWKATQERGEVTESGDFEAIDEPDYLSPLYNLGTLYDIDKYVIGRWSGVDEDQFGNTYISPFINYTDRDGNYEKEATKPARWNSATILTAIGRTEFIRIYDIVKLIIIPGILEADVPSQYLKPLIYDWVNQIYQLLNLFRWTIYDNLVGNDALDSYQKFVLVDDDYATAAALWPANFTQGIAFFSDVSASQRSGFNERTVLGRNYKINTYTSLTDKYTHQADPYEFIEATLDGVNPGTFDDFGDDVQENTYSLIGTYTNSDVFNDVTMHDNLTKYSGDVPPDLGDGVFGWRSKPNDGFVVMRWDVEDGFEYVTELN